MSDDALPPNDQQRKALADMMYRAFVEIRALGWSGRAEQAGDLADAFHNLPEEMFGRGRWHWRVFREVLRSYQDKYPGERDGNLDYVATLDSIIGEPHRVVAYVALLDEGTEVYRPV